MTRAAAASRTALGIRLGQWRLAARLARRSVRRRPGRTLLVIAMMVVPVAAMTVASIQIRTEAATSDFALSYPGVDVIMHAADPATVDRARAIDGVTVRETVEVYAPVQRADGRTARWTRIEMPGGSGPSTVRLSRLTGRMPQAAGEVWMSAQVLTALDVSIGDTITMAWPPVEWTVVGSGRAGFQESVVIAPGLDQAIFNDGVLSHQAFVTLPDGVDLESVLPDLQSPHGWQSYEIAAVGGSATLQSLLWTWVGGTLGLAVVGIIVTAAFATSARRQLTTVGLLAANGATDATTRRSLALQGTWTGAIAAVVGVVAGVAVQATVSGPLQWVVLGRPSGPTRVSPGDLTLIALTATAVATVAALLPARGAARVPVLAALAGRRPEAPPRRALAPLGVVLFVIGVALFGVAANAASENSGDNGTIIAVVAVLAGVAVLTGVCTCMPAVTDLAASIAARVSRGWRLAARSVARSRSRSAAVITAVAVTVAVATAAAAGSATNIDDHAHLLPPNVVELRPTRRAVSGDLDVAAEIADGYLPVDAAEWLDDSMPWEPRPVVPDLVGQIAEIVPGATLHPRVIVRNEGIGGTENISGGEGGALLAGTWDGLVVVDDWLADMIGLSPAERDRLAATGAMWMMVNSWIADDNGDWQPASSMVVRTAGGRHELPIATRDPGGNRPEYNSYGSYEGESSVSSTVLITPDTVARLGLPTVVNGAWLEAPTALTHAQRDQLADVIGLLDSEFARTYAAADVFDTTRGWTMSIPPDASINSTLVQAIVLGAALLLVLVVVTIGLSLAAVESRDERDVLVTVGAKPRMLRRLAGQKAAMFVATGAAIGVPVGLVPALVVLRVTRDSDLGQDNDVTVPWLALAALLVVVPAVVGLVATAASGIAQRVRPVLASNLAVD